MTDNEAIGKAVQEKKAIEGELRTLRIKADRYAENFLLLGQIFKNSAAGAVFDDQSARAGTAGHHFNSKDFNIEEVMDIAAKTRAKEDRLNDLKTLLG